MYGLVVNKYSPLVDKANKDIVDRMKMETGDRSSPIWLLVNSKYPAAFQNIWIPILEVIQDKVFRKLHRRIGREHIFVKNTVSDIGMVPQTFDWWAEEAAKENEKLRESILKFQPKFVITFGSVTYELISRIVDKGQEKVSMFWNTASLENEFERAIEDFDINKINKIPLLRRVIKGELVEDYNNSCWEECDNYFRNAGTKIADRIIENSNNLNIWI